jgi:hypothetical protein
LEVRCRVGKIGADEAGPIVERGLMEVDGEWQWRADPRLNFASAFKLSAEHIAVLLATLKAQPHLLLMAAGGLGQRMQGSEALQGLNWECLAGGHHFHLERGAVALIAERIEGFFARL